MASVSSMPGDLSRSFSYFITDVFIQLFFSRVKKLVGVAVAVVVSMVVVDSIQPGMVAVN